ncbi:Dephosphocoenzyme A kinase [Hyphodiscus hymeniophilus]|uniref:Dephosphocoenzyme A kinase n=1 Tax=Hyphodiscus hymeniophilus TaxID=353542 RepID=A0A9P6VH72_9HELO|nr:Dephosphocoenzyme A kinase [Hyphodiscus hymeniophilus]
MGDKKLYDAIEAFFTDGLVVVENAIDVAIIDRLNERMLQDTEKLLSGGGEAKFNHLNKDSTVQGAAKGGNLSQVPPIEKERLGRKAKLFSTSCLMVLLLILICILTALYGDEYNTSASYANLAMVYIFSGAYAFAFNPLTFVYPVEVLNYTQRAKGIAVGQMACYVFGSLNQYTTPIAIDSIGWRYYTLNTARDVGICAIILEWCAAEMLLGVYINGGTLVQQTFGGTFDFLWDWDELNDVGNTNELSIPLPGGDDVVIAGSTFWLIWTAREKDWDNTDPGDPPVEHEIGLVLYRTMVPGHRQSSAYLTPPKRPSVHLPFFSNKLQLNKMLLLGLTGSIATGKSTVSAILSQPPYSLPIIDADLLARKVVEPGTSGYNKIVAHFSSTTPDLLLTDVPYDKSKGPPLNRPALGRRVFGDGEERKRDRGVLNGITHPAVRLEMYKQLVYCYLKGCWAVVLDVPLLFESKLDAICGTVMVVAVSDPVIQMKRLRERDPHLSAEDAENRVKSQGDVREKAKRCEARGKGLGVVVLNDGDKDDLRRELDRVMAEVRRSSPKWWAWLLLLCPPFAGLASVWSYYRALAVNRRWQEQELQAKAKL